MKVLLFICFVVITSAVAQEFIAPPGRKREIVPDVEKKQPAIDGIVREIFTRKPWQAINPFAPKMYGTGGKFVSQDFGPATPNHSRTLTLIGVEW